MDLVGMAQVNHQLVE